MFKLTSNVCLAPVNTFVFRSNTDSDTLETYLSDFKCNNDTTLATVGSMVIHMADYSLTGGDDRLRVSMSSMFEGTSAAFFAAFKGKKADKDAKLKACQRNIPNAPSWIVNLVNAAKKADLTPANVDGFFASIGHSGTSGGAVASLINKVTPFFGDLISSNAFRDMLAPGMWTEYRVSRVSSGGIIWKNMDDLVECGVVERGGVTYDAVKAAKDSPWDIDLAMAIPEKTKAYTSIFLEASGKGIEKWYQGNKAVDDLPAVKVKAAKLIFKRYLELKSMVVNVDTLPDLAAFKNDDSIKGFW